MKVAVRLDDITPDMDWERFLKFKALLDRYQVKPLIGVVPDNRDTMLQGPKAAPVTASAAVQPPEDFWAYVRKLQEQGWSVAMHGYQHSYSTRRGGLFPLNHFSEFAGLPLEQQKRMLAEGRRILKEKGIETTLFMAPAHAYDANTLKALKENGFTELTDGFGNRPYRWKGLIFYPISFALDHTFRRKKGFSTMVVHTGTVSDEDLARYEGYFAGKEADWISFEEYRRQQAAERHFPGRAGEWLLAVGKSLLVRLRQQK